MAMTLTIHTHFAQGRRGRRLIRYGPKNLDPCPNSVSRLAKLMALAIKFDDLLKRGEVGDYAELARIHGLDPGLISRLMNLRLLASNIQEAILEGEGGAVHFKHLLLIARLADWDGQRRAWRRLHRRQEKSDTGDECALCGVERARS